MKIRFLIDENYSISHILSSMKDGDFSSSAFKKDIVALQNTAWLESKECYNLLVGRLAPGDLSEANLNKIIPFFKKVKKSKEYKKVFQQTEKYLKSCKKWWENSYDTTHQIMKELTGLDFNKDFMVYITHPSLRHGVNFGNGKIVWGHNEDWENYTVIYLWHEVLHSYLSYGDVSHSIIELITDNELRVRLNGGKYPPFEGHKNLNDTKKMILPYWKKYLKTKNKNILDFEKEMNKIFNIK